MKLTIREYVTTVCALKMQLKYYEEYLKNCTGEESSKYYSTQIETIKNVLEKLEKSHLEDYREGLENNG